MSKNCALSLVMAFLLLATVSDVYPVSLNHHDLQDPTQVVTAYFHCLKKGDLDTLIHIIAGNLLKEKRDMVKSGNYSNFLRNYYASASLGSIDLKAIENDRIEATLKIFQGNDLAIFKLILHRIDNSWLIIDDITR